MSLSSSDAEPTVRGPAAGMRVFGRYVLREILGRGGMGVVWRARDETLGEDVALKFLPDAVRWDPAAYDDLKAETRRARQLTHPNIVRIHDFVEDAGGAAISMELVQGQTLTQLRLTKPGKIFEVMDIAPWLPQLCAALDYAHTQARVVHRDLKPSNLMLTSAGVLKVADFGVARSLTDSVTRVSMMSAGTIVYMSPQQAMGDEPSPADDVYALGATLYELLTGKPPFHTGDVRTQLFQRKPDGITARRRALGSAGVEVAPGWERTILSCLAKESADRPTNLVALAAQLAKARPASARPRRSPFRGWPRRWSLGGLFAAAAAAGLWGLVPTEFPAVDPLPQRARHAPATRLVSRISFDDEVRDDGGQLEKLNSGFVVPTLDRHGRADRAMLFNGNSGISADGGSALRWSLRTPFTVACWVRLDTAEQAGSSIVVSDSGGVGGVTWRLDLGEKGQLCFVLARVQEENLQRRICTAESPLRIGRWYHVAGVSDGAELRLLVDGVVAGRAPIADAETAVPDRVRLNIGGGRLADRRWFVGVLDELRIYQGALPAVEVRALAQAAPARYVCTKGIYGEGDDWTAAVQTEFGAGAREADWYEIKAAAGPDVVRLAEELGVKVGDNAFFVSRAGRRAFDERRYYHMIRFDGKRPNYFLAHDEMGGYQLALGSWFSQQMAVLARVPLQAPQVEQVAFEGELPAGWSVSEGTHLAEGRLQVEGGTAALTRERAVVGPTVSTSWRGRMEGGGKTQSHQVELRDRRGEVWRASCAMVGGGREVLRISLGRTDRPERVVEMKPALGELVFTLVARAGVLRWRVVTGSSGTVVADERIELPGWTPAEIGLVRWEAHAEAGAATWLKELVWREEFSQ